MGVFFFFFSFLIWGDWILGVYFFRELFGVGLDWRGNGMQWLDG
jgi:hypothetical protein